MENRVPLELGISTFLHTNPKGGGVLPGERLRQAMEEIQLADQAGLDVYAIGDIIAWTTQAHRRQLF